MSTYDATTEAAELQALAEGIADSVRSFVRTVTDVASGHEAERALPLLLLASAEAFSLGARLGALTDVVPVSRFEEDPGPDADLQPLRSALATLFEGIDDYADVVDPLLDPSLQRSHISDDLTEIQAALLHGLEHHDAGRSDEALWWWQYSFLASWGERAAQVGRALVGIVSHLRLDADEDVVLEAEATALLADPGDEARADA